MRISWIARAILASVLFSASLAHADGFFRELITPSAGRHVSPCGTPYVHSFFVEPAYVDRDLLIDYRPGYGFEDGVDEQEIEFELEWALTKRLGFVLELPVVAQSPDVGPYEAGIGDMAVGTRVVVVDRPCFILSAFLEVEIPTGDADRGLGHGEAAIAPFVLWWMDLGNWVTFQGLFGPETGLETGETELIYHFSFAKSWQGPVLFPNACRCYCGHRHFRGYGHEEHDEHGHEEHYEYGNGHDHDDHSHHAPGLITAFLEFTGVTALTDPDEGSRLEIVPGIGYAVTEELEIRVAGRFPVYRPERFDSQYILSVVRHF